MLSLVTTSLTGCCPCRLGYAGCSSRSSYCSPTLALGRLRRSSSKNQVCYSQADTVCGHHARRDTRLAPRTRYSISLTTTGDNATHAEDRSPELRSSAAHHRNTFKRFLTYTKNKQQGNRGQTRVRGSKALSGAPGAG